MYDKWEPVIDDLRNARVPNEAKGHHKRLTKAYEKMEGDIDACTGFLDSLVEYLNAYYDRECILLVDEFDSPVAHATEELADKIQLKVGYILGPVVKVMYCTYLAPYQHISTHT